MTRRLASRPRRVTRRCGFALLAVLWIVAGIAGVAMAAALLARETVDTARNRQALAAARWEAIGCLERARAIVEAALVAEPGRMPGDGPWLHVDALLTAGGAGPCTLDVTAAGEALDANAVDGDGLVAALLVLGLDSARALPMRDALLDWRDADTLARDLGAERAWYLAVGRTPPRDGPVAAAAELALVRGWEDSVARALLSVHAGRAVPARAPVAVLASLPGITPRAALQLVDARARGRRLAEVADVAYALEPAERAALGALVPELAARIAPEPDAWVVRARAGEVAPVSVAERWVRSGTRVALVEREVTP